MVDAYKNELKILSQLMRLRILERMCRRRKLRGCYVGIHQLLTDIHQCIASLLRNKARKQDAYSDIPQGVALFYDLFTQPEMLTNGTWTLKLNSLYAQTIDRNLFDLLFKVACNPIVLAFIQLHAWVQPEPRHSFEYILIIAQKALRSLLHERRSSKDQATKPKLRKTAKPSMQRSFSHAEKNTDEDEPTSKTSAIQPDTLHQVLQKYQFYPFQPCIFEDHVPSSSYDPDSSDEGSQDVRYRPLNGIFQTANSEESTTPDLQFVSTPEMWLPGVDCIYCPTQFSFPAKAESVYPPYDPFPEAWSETRQPWPWDVQPAVDFLTSIS